MSAHCTATTQQADDDTQPALKKMKCQHTTTATTTTTAAESAMNDSAQVATAATAANATANGNTHARTPAEVAHARLYPNLVDSITPLISLGSRQCNTPELRRALGFTHVVQVSASPRPAEIDSEVEAGTTYYIQLEDDEEADLLPLIPPFLRFVSSLSASRGDRLLVHCDAGVSRSAALVLAFLIVVERMAFDAALALVSSCRPVVQPNAGFQTQLRQLEQQQRDTAVSSSSAAAAASANIATSSAPSAATSASASSSSSSFPSPLPLHSPVLSPFPAAADWNYSNAKILAPMVRINTLPMRLLAREYGATMVYSEEIVARKLRQCVRVERKDDKGRVWIDFICRPTTQNTNNNNTNTNEQSNTTSSSSSSSSAAPSSSSSSSSAPPRPPVKSSKFVQEYPVLTTYPGEPLVVQLGASSADDAVAAARVVERDVRAIDLNCGCPKHFSLQGGMGAALLSRPDTFADILSSLRTHISLPITCKIRLLEPPHRTLDIARLAESCGVSAIAVHARRIEDRPRHRALKERIKQVADSVNIPLIYNGDAFYAHELDDIRATTGASAVMMARGAMWNASVFIGSGGEMRSVQEVITRYLSLATDLSHHFTNAKYCVMEMLKGHVGASELFRLVTRTKDLAAMNSILTQGMSKETVLAKEGRQYQVPQVLEEREETNNEKGQTELVLSKKEKKYQAKQTRKNREGREAEAKQQVNETANASATNTAAATIDTSSSSSSS